MVEEPKAEIEGPIEEAVVEELNKLALQREGLLLDLLLSRCEILANPVGLNHVDDGLLHIATETKMPVLTVDRYLKQRLAESGCSYVEVTSGRTLRLVD